MMPKSIIQENNLVKNSQIKYLDPKYFNLMPINNLKKTYVLAAQTERYFQQFCHQLEHWFLG